jgi:hypothetical protein
MLRLQVPINKRLQVAACDVGASFFNWHEQTLEEQLRIWDEIGLEEFEWSRIITSVGSRTSMCMTIAKFLSEYRPRLAR